MLFSPKQKISAEIGPDGMTECSREMHKQWAKRDAAMALIHDAIAERTGIDRELICHLPSEYLTIAVLLGIDVNGR
jgi:hypothetical protein